MGLRSVRTTGKRSAIDDYTPSLQIVGATLEKAFEAAPGEDARFQRILTEAARAQARKRTRPQVSSLLLAVASAIVGRGYLAEAWAAEVLNLQSGYARLRLSVGLVWAAIRIRIGDLVEVVACVLADNATVLRLVGSLLGSLAAFGALVAGVINQRAITDLLLLTICSTSLVLKVLRDATDDLRTRQERSRAISADKYEETSPKGGRPTTQP